jgi:hypothetical protein
MTSTQAQRSASTLAGMAAALFCTIFWLGGGIALFAVQSGVA